MNKAFSLVDQRKRISPPRKRYEIFISSTYEDLVTERNWLRDLIVSQGHIPTGMEQFDGGGRPAWDHIKDAISTSDYFVLMVAGRYGSRMRKGPRISFVEAEYRWAQKSGKELLIYMLDDQGLMQLPSEKRERTAEGHEMLSAFRNHLSGKHLVTFCTSLDDLRAKIRRNLSNTINLRPQSGGWLPASYVASLEDEADRMRRSYERECWYRDVYTYLFNNLNPFDDIQISRLFMEGPQGRLTDIAEVIHAIRIIVKVYVEQLVAGDVRVYFAYSQSPTHLGVDGTSGRTTDESDFVYKLGVSNSRSGPWREGERFDGPSNIHNVYRSGQIREVPISRRSSSSPEDMNLRLDDEGSVVAAPVFVGDTDREVVGVVGVASPRENESMKYRALARELGVLISSLFYAYVRQQNIRAPKSSRVNAALKLRRELNDFF